MAEDWFIPDFPSPSIFLNTLSFSRVLLQRIPMRVASPWKLFPWAERANTCQQGWAYWKILHKEQKLSISADTMSAHGAMNSRGHGTFSLSMFWINSKLANILYLLLDNWNLIKGHSLFKEIQLLFSIRLHSKLNNKFLYLGPDSASLYSKTLLYSPEHFI